MKAKQQQPQTFYNTKNRIGAAIISMRKRIEAIDDPAKIASADKAARADSMFELCKYQDTQAKAFASGVLNLDEANMLYQYIGGEVPTPEKFNKLELAVRVVVISAITELMTHFIKG